MARYLFGLSLLLMFGFSFFPYLRVWGLDVWGYLPAYFPYLLTAVGAAVVFGEYYWNRMSHGSAPDVESPSSSHYLLFSLAITLVFAALLYLLRGHTHFLGDGESLVTELAKPQPLVKTREMGAGLLIVGMKNLFGGSPQKTAELVYQTVSIGSGVCFAAVAAIGSKLLFPQTRERILMLLGLLSGGSSLLFFGYAENYAPFAISILLFLLIGLLVFEKKVNRWYIFVPLALACFFHILGVLLIPTALYLLISESRLARKLSRASTSQRLTLIGLPLIAGIAAFGYLYRTDYYFRFAFVPILPDRFSIKGYSLFSPAHLADVANLLFLLVPGVLLLFALFRMQTMKKLFETRSSRFLLITALTTVFAASVLDPKLGMPRDWDLFSFPGVPISALILWLLLTRTSRSRAHISIAILFITLGFLSLLPRALVQAVPEKSVALFTDYLELDPPRARTGMHNLAKYYVSVNDSVSAAKCSDRRRALFPYERLVSLAEQNASAGVVGMAKVYAQQALQLSGNHADSWLALAFCYLEEGKYDSALEAAKIADGLNPYNYTIRHELAMAYVRRGDRNAGEKIWLALVASDTSKYGAAFSLACFYQQNGDVKRYADFLTLAARRADAPADLSMELAKHYVESGDLAAAAQACRQALAKGADSAHVRVFVVSHPGLSNFLTLPLGSTP